MSNTPDNETPKLYLGRISKVLTYIENHLDSPLSLDTLAELAHYSPFHFHRLFKAITRETPNGYINRKRVEKAASVLLRDNDIGISEVGEKYGFNDNSSFTRAFRKFYGISPSEFRKNKVSQYSKIGQTDSKNRQKPVQLDIYICNIENHKNWIDMKAKVEVKNMPEMNLAYVRHVGEFQKIGQAYEKLMKWAGPNGLLGRPGTKTVTVYHDDPSVTEISKLRQSACILVDAPVATQDPVGFFTFPATRCVVGEFEIGFDEFEKSWQSMFVWLNENGYKANDKGCFEIYHNDFRTHPENKSIISICVPVQ